MPTLTVPGTTTPVPGVQLPTGTTDRADAWLGPYLTVQLTQPWEGLRVHVDGAPGTSQARLRGRWHAIGDFIATYSEYLASRALPAPFTKIALCTFQRGTILNVGRCAPLFNLAGGGEQAEWVSGPDVLYRPLNATWSNQAGHA